MRSILVLADRSDAARGRIDTALSLARMTEGHVTLLVDTPVMRFTAVDAMGGAMVATDALQEAVRNDDAYAQEIEAHLSRADVPCSVMRAEAEPLDAMSQSARLSDIAIVSRGDPLAGDLPLAMRGPVLAVSDERELAFPLARACIAWDGSAEAAAALRGAVPLLAGCGEVTVITVEDAPREWPATDAVEYLSRHGVSAEMQVLPRIGSVEETLLREVQMRDAQLLIMGAFGHSRVREFLFGGVTRSMLEMKHGPALLLAH
ncbi:universal stress protein [Novosphingobium sp. TH158]|uniref:universal stress protein n=1 Tax=Novosphingobium sp. TH158 TaxID=2067455 RepID=UPI000C7D486A|nr:universal stress protein [Novosphingobium sp. TH158]PLK27538.1 universal stress protein UspA [Novosphingobium sp. TH158]